MVRSSMAAFYPLPRCLFYRVGRFHCGEFIIVFLRPPVRSELKKVVHWMSEILFAAEIAFRCLDGGMPQQELNLLQLAPATVAQFRAGSPQVMRRNMLQARSLAATLDYVPHDILRDAFSPHLSRPGNCSKDPPLRHLGCHYPLIECRFDPLWNGHRPDVAALTDQVYHRPVPLAHLDFIQLQAHKFRSAKTTTEQHGQHRIIALGTHSVSPRILEHFRTLLRAQPITGPESELLDSLDAANPRAQIGTQQASVGGFVSQATHGCKLLVDGVGGQMPRFQVHAIAHDDDAVEGEPRLGAVPSDELVDGVLVDSARSWRAEAIEN